MKKPELDRTFLACDIYSRWKRLVASAQNSITIYTPFFDGLVLSLFNANSRIGADRKTIVTNITPLISLQHPKQLYTIKEALSQGISVLSLKRLHAKVLLIDERYITIGSQNFTCYGRNSKETSVVPSVDLTGSRLLATLIDWREQAEEIDEDWIDRLISDLASHIQQLKKLRKDTEREFEKILKQHEKKKQAIRRQHFEKLARQSRIQLNQEGSISASIKTATGKYGKYDILLADANSDMTKWLVTNPDGLSEEYPFDRLCIYPVIQADSGRMGFARIGKTRITYIRNVLKAPEQLPVGTLNMDVEITFPETETQRRNIIVELSHKYRGSCKFSVLFTGDSAVVKKKRYSKGSHDWQEEYKGFISTLERRFFNSPQALNDFFRRFFCHYKKYKRLARHKKNVRDYLEGTSFRLSVIEYQGKPFLLVAQQ